MSNRIGNFIIRGPDGVRTASSLVLGRGVQLTTTAGGLPELLATRAGEFQLMPSGGDDTQAIRDAVAQGPNVRLGPGVFTISGTITLGNPNSFGSPGNRIQGSGPLRTVVRMTHPGVGFQMRNSLFCAVEGLTIKGPGNSSAAIAIQVPFFSSTTGYSAFMTVRDVRIEDVGMGLDVENTSNFTAENLLVSCGGAYGLHLRTGNYYGGSTNQLALRNIEVVGGSTACVRVAGWHDAVLERITLRNGAAAGLSVSGGTGWVISAIRADNCTTGVLYSGGAGSVSGVLTELCVTGVRVENARDVVLAGCRAQKARIGSGLVVKDSQDVVVNGFVSDHTGILGVAPYPTHVVVQNSPGIFFGGVRVVNSATPPPWELDVSAAGGRVLFAQHNFDPARINSGGNFAAL
jgi:hypothetical protein